MRSSLLFLVLSLIGNSSVNCSYFFSRFFYATEPAGESIGLETNFVPEPEIEKKKIVFLDESVDPERELFEQEMEKEQKRAAEIRAIKQAYYLASLPADHDSMEMISRESGLFNRIKSKIETRRRQIGDLVEFLTQLRYGHDQYSEESESASDKAEYLDQDDPSSSYDSDNASVTTQDMLDLVVGKAPEAKQKDQKQEVDSKDEDTFELIDDEEGTPEIKTADINDID